MNKLFTLIPLLSFIFYLNGYENHYLCNENMNNLIVQNIENQKISYSEYNKFTIGGIVYQPYEGESQKSKTCFVSGLYCFDGTNLIIPSKVTNKGITYKVDIIGPNAFNGSSSIKSIVLPMTIQIIGKNSFQDSGITTLEIPASVTQIGYEAFKWSKIKSISISNSVTHIGEGAFACCDDLESISLSNSLKVIENELFDECNKLKTINLPNNIIVIGKGAFYRCKELKYISIPSSVEKIGPMAFSGCSKLETIECRAIDPPRIYDNTFSFDEFLIVPKGSKSKYSEAIGWHKFGVINEK